MFGKNISQKKTRPLARSRRWSSFHKISWTMKDATKNTTSWFPSLKVKNGILIIMAYYNTQWIIELPSLKLTHVIYDIYDDDTTLPETNSSPLKIGRNPKGKDHLPTTNLQVRAVSFREGNPPKKKQTKVQQFSFGKSQKLAQRCTKLIISQNKWNAHSWSYLHTSTLNI